MKGYVADIEAKTLANENYREVLFTGPDSQLVLMTLKPGEEIGEEAHDLDQFLRVEAGEGEAILDGEAHALKDGVAVVIPKGIRHNIRNTGSAPLKLYTLYTAKEHPDGTIHPTKEDSIRDEGH